MLISTIRTHAPVDVQNMWTEDSDASRCASHNVSSHFMRTIKIVGQRKALFSNCFRLRASEFRQREFIKKRKRKSLIDVSQSLRNSTSRGIGLKLRKVVCRETGYTDAISVLWRRKDEISKTRGIWPRYLTIVLCIVHKSGKRRITPDTMKLLNRKRKWKLNTADNNPAISNNSVEKRVITVSSENGFMIPRISFGKLCAATYASAHATLLPRALHIIVKNYSARSFHELVFSDLSEL